MKEHLMRAFQVDNIERTTQTGHLGKWTMLTNQERYGMTIRKIDRHMRKFFDGIIGERERIGGFQHPRRPNGPTTNGNHDDYLAQVEIETGVGEEVDGKEVEVSIEKQRRKWKQYSPGGTGTGKKPRRTYADTAKNGSQLGESEITVAEQKQDMPENASEGKTFEELAKEIDQRLWARLAKQEEETKLMFLKVKEDSGRMLEDILGRFKKEQISQLQEINKGNMEIIKQMAVNMGKGMAEMSRKFEEQSVQNKEFKEEIQKLHKAGRGRRLSKTKISTRSGSKKPESNGEVSHIVK